MKVILSVDSIKFPLTGIGRYTYELAKQLQLQKDLDFKLFSNGTIVLGLPKHGEAKAKRNIVARMRMQLRKSNLVTRVYRTLVGIRSQIALRSHREAIFHGPGFYLPKFTGHSVATFHDLSIFTWAHCHPPERVRFMQRELKLTLQRASMLITDSEYTRHEIANYFGYPLDKIRTVPLACSPDFHPRNAIETNSILNKFGLVQDCYTLYAGTIEPRKNIESLLDAYAMLPDAIRARWPLVLAGYRGWRSEVLHQRIEAAVSAGWARYLGYVSNSAQYFPLISAQYFPLFRVSDGYFYDA